MTERDGKLYGRGSTDDKGPVLDWLNAIEAYNELKQEIPVNLKVKHLKSFSNKINLNFIFLIKSKSSVLKVSFYPFNYKLHISNLSILLMKLSKFLLILSKNREKPIINGLLDHKFYYKNPSKIVLRNH